MSVCRTHVWGQAITTPLPPFLHVPGSGTPRGQREGAGSLLVISRLQRPGGVSHGSDPSDTVWHGTCHNWWITHHLRGTPLQVRQSQRLFCQQQRRWGGMKRGGGIQREEAWVGGGGGEVMREHMCGRLFEFASSLRKTIRSLHLNPPHASFWAIATTVLLRSWSVALWRIDSRWKKCTLVRHIRKLQFVSKFHPFLCHSTSLIQHNCMAQPSLFYQSQKSFQNIPNNSVLAVLQPCMTVFWSSPFPSVFIFSVWQVEELPILGNGDLEEVKKYGSNKPTLNLIKMFISFNKKCFKTNNL